MAILEIINLYKTFHDKAVGLKDINTTIKSSELLLITGENGSGKTLLMRHLNGLVKPDKGEVLLKGKNIFDDINLTRQKIGMIFQNPDTQIIGQTVEEDIAFGPENLGLNQSEIIEKVNKAISIMGLEELKHKNPIFLSGGEKKRLSIAGVLAMSPEIIILDEPFAGLDFNGVRDLLKYIIDLKKSGKTIIIISHDIEKILAHTDRMLIMHKGMIVKDGTPEELINQVEKYGIRNPGIPVKSMTWLQKSGLHGKPDRKA